MAFYKLCNNGEARTTDYMFSVKTKDDPMLLALKEDIARHNKWVRDYIREVAKTSSIETTLEYLGGYRSLRRVRLMSRGPRAVYAKLEGLYPRAYDSFIPHKYAEYFDVYAGEDSHAMYWFRDQISNDLTPGQQRLISKLEMEEHDLKFRNIAKLRENGIHLVYEQGKQRPRKVGTKAYDEKVSRNMDEIAKGLERVHNETDEERKERLERWIKSLKK